MSTHNSSRIWEQPSNPATSPINAINHDPKPAQLPSIATLTNELPSRNKQPASPSYGSNNRTSDPWGSTTQSTRKSSSNLGEWSHQSSPRNDVKSLVAKSLTNGRTRFLCLLLRIWLCFLDQLAAAGFEYKSVRRHHFISRRLLLSNICRCSSLAKLHLSAARNANIAPQPSRNITPERQPSQ